MVRNRFLFALVAVLSFATGYAVEPKIPPPPVPRGMIIIVVDGAVAAFAFSDNQGIQSVVSYDACAQDAVCKALAVKLYDSKQYGVAAIQSAASIECQKQSDHPDSMPMDSGKLPIQTL